MRLLIYSAAIFLLVGCATTSETWTIKLTSDEVNNNLYAIPPGKTSGPLVLKNPKVTHHYTITDDGKYLGYISDYQNESKLFIQHIKTGLLAPSATVNNLKGSLAANNTIISYDSPNDKISIAVVDIEEKFKKIFGEKFVP